MELGFSVCFDFQSALAVVQVLEEFWNMLVEGWVEEGGLKGITRVRKGNRALVILARA